ncbi:hypothetical protein [Streptomyces sp. SCL15-4]|uniref:hypothetical protein n=1 Tax=Streptomyces sp. SCL15-4 TaxID=2967221 RepID=UPI00296753DC|nr:hypothetical protein [Streptomyces sp. SCL15-4]
MTLFRRGTDRVISDENPRGTGSADARSVPADVREEAARHLGHAPGTPHIPHGNTGSLA